MKEGYYQKLWWEIIVATLGFSVIPLVILGAVVYQQFSSSYSAKIMEDMKIRVEYKGKIAGDEIKFTVQREGADQTREFTAKRSQ